MSIDIFASPLLAKQRANMDARDKDTRRALIGGVLGSIAMGSYKNYLQEKNRDFMNNAAIVQGRNDYNEGIRKTNVMKQQQELADSYLGGREKYIEDNHGMKMAEQLLMKDTDFQYKSKADQDAMKREFANILTYGFNKDHVLVTKYGLEADEMGLLGRFNESVSMANKINTNQKYEDLVQNRFDLPDSAAQGFIRKVFGRKTPQDLLSTVEGSVLDKIGEQEGLASDVFAMTKRKLFNAGASYDELQTYADNRINSFKDELTNQTSTTVPTLTLDGKVIANTRAIQAYDRRTQLFVFTDLKGNIINPDELNTIQRTVESKNDYGETTKYIETIVRTSNGDRVVGSTKKPDVMTDPENKTVRSYNYNKPSKAATDTFESIYRNFKDIGDNRDRLENLTEEIKSSSSAIKDFRAGLIEDSYHEYEKLKRAGIGTDKNLNQLIAMEMAVDQKERAKEDNLYKNDKNKFIPRTNSIEYLKAVAKLADNGLIQAEQKAQVIGDVLKLSSEDRLNIIQQIDNIRGKRGFNGDGNTESILVQELLEDGSIERFLTFKNKEGVDLLGGFVVNIGKIGNEPDDLTAYFDAERKAAEDLVDSGEDENARPILFKLSEFTPKETSETNEQYLARLSRKSMKLNANKLFVKIKSLQFREKEGTALTAQEQIQQTQDEADSITGQALSAAPDGEALVEALSADVGNRSTQTKRRNNLLEVKKLIDKEATPENKNILGGMLDSLNKVNMGENLSGGDVNNLQALFEQVGRKEIEDRDERSVLPPATSYALGPDGKPRVGFPSLDKFIDGFKSIIPKFRADLPPPTSYAFGPDGERRVPTLEQLIMTNRGGPSGARLDMSGDFGPLVDPENRNPLVESLFGKPFVKQIREQDDKPFVKQIDELRTKRAAKKAVEEIPERIKATQSILSRPVSEEEMDEIDQQIKDLTDITTFSGKERNNIESLVESIPQLRGFESPDFVQKILNPALNKAVKAGQISKRGKDYIIDVLS